MIWNESLMREFFENVLPPLEDYEVFISLLAARKKYYPLLRRSEEILDRKILRANDSKRLIQKIKRFAKGPFYQDDKELPEEALVLYIGLNPKHTLKAFNLFVKEMQDSLSQITFALLNQNQPDFSKFKKIDVNLFSAIHRSTSRHVYWLIDIDRKDEFLLDAVVKKLEDNVAWISETKNGFHVIVKVGRESGRIIFGGKGETGLKQIEGVEVHKEAMTPIPGTLQGGFKVRKCIY